MANNTNLKNANKAKQDEFYTQLVDIEKEMRYYKDHFKNKVILCNCDDPYESNFFKYFALNFNFLGLKKLIATCYVGSPIANTQLSLFDYESEENKTTRSAHKIEITQVNDYNSDGAVDLSDVEYLLTNKKNILTKLKGDGDFRSMECIQLLKEADIIVTNPPFSLFREYVAQLIEYDKKFIIIGNINAISYKEIFPLLKSNKMWLGASISSGDRKFLVPDSAFDVDKVKGGFEVDANGNKYVRVVGVRWFTNLDIQKRHEKIILYKHYNEKEYPKYDNYDAINSDKVANIPCDYNGIIGVPISFMDKYNPEQFKIVGWTLGRGSYEVGASKIYSNAKQISCDGKVSTGSKVNDGPTILTKNKPLNKTYYTADNTNGYLQILYARILIQRIDNESRK